MRIRNRFYWSYPKEHDFSKRLLTEAQTWDATLGFYDKPFDDEKEFYAHGVVFGRFGDNRVNDNPLYFHDARYYEFAKQYSWAPTGTGMDFSEIYYDDPVRVTFYMYNEKTDETAPFREWKW